MTEQETNYIVELIRRVRRGDDVKMTGAVRGFCGITWDDVRENPLVAILPEDHEPVLCGECTDGLGEWAEWADAEEIPAGERLQCERCGA